MSTLKVEVVRVEDVQPHPNADRLEIATIKGWQCVVGKDEFKAGDKGIYFPIDSVLPDAALSSLFATTKIKPPSRIKTIKLRGAISQGLLAKRCNISDTMYVTVEDFAIGDDLTEKIGVVKYEPPVKDLPGGYGVKNPVKKVDENPHFEKYTDLEHWKNHQKVFEDGELVVMVEKIHGTNFRCGYLPTVVDTWWKRVKRYFGLLPEYEFVYGSRNVQLQGKKYDGHFTENVYSKIVKQYDLENKLKQGEVLYGEIYGDGIQKGYTYGCGPGEQKLAAFDLQRDGAYLDFGLLYVTLDFRGIPLAPVVTGGPFNAEWAKRHTTGVSLLGPEPIREGIVVRTVEEQKCYLGRKILKMVSDEYLLRDNSDFH